MAQPPLDHNKLCRLSVVTPALNPTSRDYQPDWVFEPFFGFHSSQAVATWQRSVYFSETTVGLAGSL